MINLHTYEHSSYIYGPGKRFVLWVQGCLIRCSGCWNEAMWSFTAKHLFSPENLAALILKTPDIEGITILGGEPMHQSDDLLCLIKILKEHKLTVFLYTGYDFHELIKQSQKELFQNSDIVISGRYIKELRDINLQWRGSSNQLIHYNSARYRELIIEEGNYIQINIKTDGSITISGYPSEEIIDLVITN